MAKRKKKRIASRGSVNTTILKTLVNGDKYGYEIIKEVEEYSDGKIVLKQPSLYSSLSRFEEKGIVSSYWGDSDIGGRRHYYHLTDAGQKYYRSAVLKIHDENDEIIDNIEESLKVEENIEKESILDTNKTTELSDTSIPAILNFEDKNDSVNVLIPDHNFSQTTTIEDKDNIESVESKKNQKQEAWQELISRVKSNNNSCAKSINKKLHYKKPTKSQKVILDSDGIYKLRDEDYTPNKHIVAKSKIVDNVGKRIVNNNYYDSIYGKKENNIKQHEMTSEEKLIKNQNFEERFNLLTQSKLKPVTPTIQKINDSPIADKEPEIDYRSKLDILLNSKKPETTIETTPRIEENNLFNYIEEDETKFENNTQENSFEEDKFINFDSDDFETKADNKQYIEEISNYSSTDTIKINRYENKSSFANIESETYVLINKVKCIFGVILLLLCSIELIASFLILNNNGYLQNQDTKIFIIGFIITVLIALTFILPILFNARDHKINNFKLKYAEVLGILTFLVSLILIYCVNALLGFDLENFNYFAVELIIPAILTFNFVIMPPIYYALINSKRFYD